MKSRARVWRLWARKAPSGGTGEQGDPEILGRKIHRTALILIGGGFLFCLLLGGWAWALGYAIGGALSVTNLELLRRAVARGFAAETGKTLARLVSGSLLRLLGIGIMLFVVLKWLPVQIIGLALGLMVGPVVSATAGMLGRDRLGEM
jgi:hypothetical protein